MMSFRTRLSSFFVLIVVVPMAAVGFLVFRLIDDSQSGKADARASAAAGTAASVYANASTEASLRARAVASDIALIPPAKLDARVRALAAQIGLARVTVSVGDARKVDIGDHTAIAPGIAVVRAAPSAARPDGRGLDSSPRASSPASSPARASRWSCARAPPRWPRRCPPPPGGALPHSRGTVTIGHTTYQVVTQTFAGFDEPQVVGVDPVRRAARAARSAPTACWRRSSSPGSSSWPSSSRCWPPAHCTGSSARFLDAARRLAGGDFSSPVPTSGRDEFALLGEEFNNMSRQLERRLAELEQERARVRQSIRRIGEAFASGLDRDALLELALQTAMDATEADRGRVSARQSAEDALTETVHVGRLAGLEGPIYDAERRALDLRRGRRGVAGRRPSRHRRPGRRSSPAVPPTG